MITKKQIIEKAVNLGFEDIGFTTAEPFTGHKEYLLAKQEEYGWAEKAGLSLINGTDPQNILPNAKSIIVLVDLYFREAFPPAMEKHFGRCYLDDDRATKNGLTLRIKAFRQFLQENGIDSRVPFDLPHRLAAVRAGLGSFGKNCLFYSNRIALQSSWVTPLPVVIDREFPADAPAVGGCPEWCRSACVAACPTGALSGKGGIDPRKCISFMSYYNDGPTPKELREPMGLQIYGCDRCQDVCPRNGAWLARKSPANENVAAKAADFELPLLLAMDETYYMTKVMPHMFYNPRQGLRRWKRNVARVMGNTRDEKYVPNLVRAFKENEDEELLCQIAWALGRIGGAGAKAALLELALNSGGAIREEITAALNRC